EDVIVISDDENDTPEIFEDSSLMILEDCADKRDSSFLEQEKSNEVIDDELLITFSQKAVVLPHARYDCTTYLFSKTEAEMNAPVEDNHKFCEQCYCYICDKLASECHVWISPGNCHCNSHKWSTFWKAWRDKKALGYLEMFHFDLLEVDADLRQAEFHLMQFEADLSSEYSKFLQGRLISLESLYACSCYCHAAMAKKCQRCSSNHATVLAYDYSEVHKIVFLFLDKAEREKARKSAVMLLGAAKYIVAHKQPSSLCLSSNTDYRARASEAIPLLLLRITNILQTLLVTSDFSPSFSKKLKTFVQSLVLPANCTSFYNSVNVIPWDDALLSAVLRGQNISGERIVKGRKETLFEPIQVVKTRVAKLKEQQKYRELARYLKVVKSTEKACLQSMRDYLPLFLCKAGEFMLASDSFFFNSAAFCCIACRLSPMQFGVYLKILRSGQVLEPCASAKWELVKGAKPLKKCDLIKTGIRIMNYNSAVFSHPASWADLIQAACSSEELAEGGLFTCVSLQEPDEGFQQKTREIASGLIEDLKANQSISIPRHFYKQFPDQTLLMLVTQSLAYRLTVPQRISVLVIVMAFKQNIWALKFLFRSLSVSPDALVVFVDSLLEDLYKDNLLL
uniref:Uncharacterized protein n=2 Tax=Lepisosteus oculatus TaxID=7918 RepID=W5MBZ6_LEPOC